MKITCSIFFLFCIMQGLLSQPAMKTVVTQGPVVAGESFRVQYVLDELSAEDDFFAPAFNGFRVVSGPEFYEGASYGPDGPHKLTNIIYTLVALKPGQFRIPGASAKVSGKILKSPASSLVVLGLQEAITRGLVAEKTQPNPDYYLKPGEDPYQKINRNLFLKVSVDRQTVYVGQPVIATFKLYSRLESRSDIVKNPGLYGFTVQDIVGLRERKSSLETVNGRAFDVHTIRQVQMYPLRPGSFQVDPMQVKNRVEFYTKAVNITPGQQIIEGVIADDDDYRGLATTKSYETDMATEPVTITVKAPPETARPANYNGATGRFTIDTYLEKKEIRAGEEGVFVVQITGSGNFTQLAAPQVNWPAGLEGFDPEVKDAIDLTSSPMKGQRNFRFHFVPSKKGTYELPSIGFAFFNPDSNHYQNIDTKKLTLQVMAAGGEPKGLGKLLKKDDGSGRWWIIGLFVAAIIAGLVFLFLKLARGKKVIVAPAETISAPASVHSLLEKAAALAGTNERSYYIELRNAAWAFFSGRFGLSGSALSRSGLQQLLNTQGVPVDDQLEVTQILDHCETGMFTNVSGDVDQARWVARTEAVLLKIDRLAAKK